MKGRERKLNHEKKLQLLDMKKEMSCKYIFFGFVSIIIITVIIIIKIEGRERKRFNTYHYEYVYHIILSEDIRYLSLCL